MPPSLLCPFSMPTFLPSISSSPIFSVLFYTSVLSFLPPSLLLSTSVPSFFLSCLLPSLFVVFSPYLFSREASWLAAAVICTPCLSMCVCVRTLKHDLAAKRNGFKTLTCTSTVCHRNCHIRQQEYQASVRVCVCVCYKVMYYNWATVPPGFKTGLRLNPSSSLFNKINIPISICLFCNNGCHIDIR